MEQQDSSTIAPDFADGSAPVVENMSLNSIKNIQSIDETDNTGMRKRRLF